MLIVRSTSDKKQSQKNMTDLSIMYETVSPINATVHGDVSIKPVTGFEFAQKINSVPVLATEFAAAASDMALVFSGDDEELLPVALLGVTENKNLYVNDNGQWAGRYVPAFLRRYPFIFARDGEESLTLCIDESYTGFNREGRGERLFDTDGERTQYLENMLNFVTEYQRQHSGTKAFCKRLSDLGLLEPATLSAPEESGEVRRLVGFQVLSRQKFKAIDDSKLLEMFRRDELELCYLHMHSLKNIGIQLNKTADVTEELTAATIQ